MNSTGSSNTKKIRRRSFFYYIGAAAIGAAAVTRFPFNLFKKAGQAVSGSTSIKVTEDPNAIRRTGLPVHTGKGPVNG